MGEASAAPAPVSLGAAALPTPMPPPTVLAERKAGPDPLIGIRGWLIFPAIGTVIAPFPVALQTVNLIDVVSKAADRSHPIFAYLYGEIACNVALMALDAWAWFFCFRRADNTLGYSSQRSWPAQ